MIELILNPIAGHGRSRRTLQDVEQELRGRGVDFHVSETNAKGHATQLARMAIERGAAGIAVLGGDGLVSEVTRVLMDSNVPLYFVPCGTGNDFIKTLKLPNDPIRALRLQLDRPSRKIDCGTVNGFGFLNVAGTGFDIEVLLQTERFKNTWKGIFAYLLGLLSGLKNYRPFAAEISLDGVTEHRGYTIISVSNGRYIGGGMKVAPLADPSDGVFDVMLVEALPKWKFYLLVPLFPFGLHSRLRCTRRVLAKDVLIKTDQPLTVQADGELKQLERAHFVCHERRITIHCP